MTDNPLHNRRRHASRALHFTTGLSFAESVARLQALHRPGETSETHTRTLLTLDHADGDRVDFHLRRLDGRYDQAQMQGSLIHQGDTALLTATLTDRTRLIWAAALMVGGLLGLLLLVQASLPLLVMVGMVPALALRDNVMERRGSRRLASAVRAAFAT